MAAWRQPSLFGDLAFLPRRAKLIKRGKETFRTKKYGTTPLGIISFGRTASRSKVTRKRRAS